MKIKEITKGIEDIEEVLNASDGDFAKRFNSKENEFLVYEKSALLNQC